MPWKARASWRNVDVLGGAAGDRADHEQRRTDHEDLAPAVEVGERAGGEQERGEAQRVGVDHPLQVGEARAELALDVGERDVHDRDVEQQDEDARDRPRRGSTTSGRGRSWSRAPAAAICMVMSSPLSAGFRQQPNHHVPNDYLRYDTLVRGFVKCLMIREVNAWVWTRPPAAGELLPGLADQPGPPDVAGRGPGHASPSAEVAAPGRRHPRVRRPARAGRRARPGPSSRSPTAIARQPHHDGQGGRRPRRPGAGRAGPQPRRPPLLRADPHRRRVRPRPGAGAGTPRTSRRRSPPVFIDRRARGAAPAPAPDPRAASWRPRHPEPLLESLALPDHAGPRPDAPRVLGRRSRRSASSPAHFGLPGRAGERPDRSRRPSWPAGSASAAPASSQMVDHLERRGLVERRRLESDRRTQVLHLLPGAEEVVTEAKAACHDGHRPSAEPRSAHVSGSGWSCCCSGSSPAS